MTQGCFRTWPSCNSLRSFGIYWSIWENKSCTPCRQKERQNTWRSCCCGCPSQQQCLAYFPPDNQGRRPPGATPDLGSRDTDAGQKPTLKLEGMLHLAHRALGLDYSAASWSPFLCFSILPQVCFIRTILCWVFSFSNCTKIHKTFLQSSWKAVPKNCNYFAKEYMDLIKNEFTSLFRCLSSLSLSQSMLHLWTDKISFFPAQSIWNVLPCFSIASMFSKDKNNEIRASLTLSFPAKKNS